MLKKLLHFSAAKFLLFSILTITTFFLIVSCQPKEKGPEIDPTTGLLLVLANPVNCTSRSCSCNVRSTNICYDWTGTSLSIANARTSCSALTGTLNESSGCPTLSVVGNCAGIQSRVNVLSQISYYDFVTNVSSANHTTNSSNCLSLGTAMTYTKSTTSPRVRFINNSGSAENYTLHTSVACGAGTLAATIGNVANGVTTAYFTIPEGNFAISFNGGTSCSALLLNVGNGMVRTVTSTSVWTITASTE